MSVVTGANGFLGAHLTALLVQRGETVRALKRQDSRLDEFKLIMSYHGLSESQYKESVEWVNGDLNDISVLDELVKGQKVVYHCAAKISFKGKSDDLIKSNVEGTANLVNACLSNSDLCLVHVSSVAAIGRSDSQEIIHEKSMWADDKNNTAYAVSKHLSELEVRRGIEEGLEAVIVNPGIILGYGSLHKGSSRIFQSVKNGLKFYTSGVNGFVGVEDVAETMIKLVQSDFRNDRVILVTDNVSYKNLFAWMANAWKVKSPSMEIKLSYFPVLKWVLKVYTLLKPRTNYTSETLRTSLKVHRYDNSLWKKLGFQPKPIQELVQDTISTWSKP